jgi:putative hydrolase of the HAD superfamily
MVIRAVILDFGGTLAEGKMDWPEFHAAVHQLLKSLGYVIELVRLKKAIGGALEELERVRARGEELTLEEVYASALKKLDVPPDEETLEMIHEQFRRHYKSTLYPCTEEVLGKLAERYKIALISNTMSNQPRLILEETGLIRHFRVVVCSRDLGIRKPNPRIFTYVLKKLGVDPEETVHVGDSVEADMGGASKAGIRPIWIKTSSVISWTGYAISSICDLPNFLANLDNP